MFSTRRIATMGGDKYRDEFSLAFDGSNDYVDCGSDSSLDVGTSKFSVTAWFKVAADSNGTIVSKGDGLSSANYNDHGWAISYSMLRMKFILMFMQALMEVV